MKRLIIAIDGPSGSGKSTLGKRLARRLGYQYIDTGAMYRAVAWQALRQGVDLDDAAAVAQVAEVSRIELETRPDGVGVRVDGRDVTEAIRTPAVAQGASKVSAFPAVRRVLVRIQQALGRRGGIVMDGRDIGTVVFPDADVKVYLDASEDERARRRCAEDGARGIAADMAATREAIRERDHRDKTREDSPLRIAVDACYLDTTGLTIDAVLERIESLVKERRGGACSQD
jgi:cytidylate kinase